MLWFSKISINIDNPKRPEIATLTKSKQFKHRHNTIYSGFWKDKCYCKSSLALFQEVESPKHQQMKSEEQVTLTGSYILYISSHQVFIQFTWSLFGRKGLPVNRYLWELHLHNIKTVIIYEYSLILEYPKLYR